jgi:hypothetical protein
VCCFGGSALASGGRAQVHAHDAGDEVIDLLVGPAAELHLCDHMGRTHEEQGVVSADAAFLLPAVGT